MTVSALTAARNALSLSLQPGVDEAFSVLEREFALVMPFLEKVAKDSD
jgi:hypothetical protein